MSSTILLSDNGATSGISGYQLTGGTDGTLTIQTTTSGGTPTTAMTINTSQNVGIGTSSPAYKLHVSNYMGLGTQASSGAGAGISLIPSSTLTNWLVGANYTNSGTFEIIPSTAGGGSTFTTPALLINSSGNVGIGTSSPGAKLAVVGPTGNGLYYSDGTVTNYIGTSGSAVAETGTTTNHPYRFITNGSERARIDNSGNLLVGTTSTSTTSGVGLKSIYDASYPYFSTVGTATTNSNVAYTLYSTGSAAYRFYVGYGGTIYATSTTITGISDRRLKENVRDLDDGLDKVLALKPRKFDWKENKGKGIANDRGFIAQEFEQVFPDMIEEWQDPAPEGEEPYKAVNANLIPTLVKAIQEQQAIIEQLRADVEALKGQA